MSFLFGNNDEELYYLRDYKNSSQRLASKIEEIRHDHKNGLTTIGEAADNLTSWGEATNMTIESFDTCLKIIDNGKGINSVTRMSEILLLGNKNSLLKENPEQKNIMGKFGLGLPKGSIIIGNKVTVISKIDYRYMTTIADWSQMMVTDTYKPATRDSTTEEIEEYQLYYDQGTYVKYENFNKYVKFDIKSIYDYLICLYKNGATTLREITIKENNQLVNFGEEYPNPITTFKDTTYFTETPETYKIKGYIYKYQNEHDGEFYVCFENDYLPKPLTYQQLSSDSFIDDMLIYKLEIYITTIDDAKIKKSHYVNKKNDELIGIKIYRQNRDITQLGAQKWKVIDPNQKMYRDKGLRIRLDFNGTVTQTNYFDEDFKVSSLKCIDEPSFYFYSESLKLALAKIGNRGETLYEAKKWNEKIEAEKIISQLFENIKKNRDTFTEEQMVVEKQFLTNFYETGLFKVDPENNEVIPFKFDKRNGFYKKFYESGYQELTKLLEKSGVEELGNTMEISFENDDDDSNYRLELTEFIVDKGNKVYGASDGEDNRGKEEGDDSDSDDGDKLVNTEDDTSNSELITNPSNIPNNKLGNKPTISKNSFREMEEESDTEEFIINTDSSDNENDFNILIVEGKSKIETKTVNVIEDTIEELDTMITRIFCTSHDFHTVKEKLKDIDPILIRPLYDAIK